MMEWRKHGSFPPCNVLCLLVWTLAGLVSLAGARTFVHPGMLHTETDLRRMREMVAQGRSPWFESWVKLQQSPLARPGVEPRAVETVIRGNVPGQNVGILQADMARAYQLALRWHIGGDRECADSALRILDAWGSSLRKIDGNADRYLAAGLYGYQLANAAELMRDYEGWERASFHRFQDMMQATFLPLNRAFLFGDKERRDHNDAAITNYWANWDLCNIASLQAIGILCDRADLYQEALAYLRAGRGNGSLLKAVYYLHEGNLGQWQEAGRDQGHSTLGIALMGAIMEAAWNQGDDLYAEDHNRFLSGAEYVAKYNLGHEVPFQAYAWGTGPRGDRRVQEHISPDQGALRAGWELVVNHYVKRRGIAAPFSEAYAARLRPEPGPGGHPSTYDQPGFGTLTMTRLPENFLPRPSGLRIHRVAGRAILSWWGAAGATSYQIRQAMTPEGPWETIGETGEAEFSHVVTKAPPGLSYYQIVGVGGSGETPPSETVSWSAEPRQIYRLGDPHASAALLLREGGGKSTEIRKLPVSLDGSGQFIQLPPGLLSELSDFTISARLQVGSGKPWARIFDFSDERGQWMFFTTSAGEGGKPRFETSTTYGHNAQRVESEESLPLDRPFHLALTLSGRSMGIWLEGRATGSGEGMDFPPYQLGQLPNCRVGRSAFSRDPFLQAIVEDFQIYDGALTPDQIAILARGGDLRDERKE